MKRNVLKRWATFHFFFLPEDAYPKGNHFSFGPKMKRNVLKLWATFHFFLPEDAYRSSDEK